MALKSDISVSDKLTAAKPTNIERIEVIDKDMDDNKICNSNQNCSVKYCEKVIFPSDEPEKVTTPSWGKRCRLFIQEGQECGKTLLGKGRRIKKKFGCGVMGDRADWYLVKNSNSVCRHEKPICLKRSKHFSDRARRSRLAEDALFYEDKFELTHLHGHVKEDSPKTFLQVLHKKSKSKKRLKRSSSYSHSPVLENCICLKYLNSQNNNDIEFNDQSNTNTLSSDGNHKASAVRPKNNTGTVCKTRTDNDNQNASETDSLHQESPTLRPASMDIGMLLSLSLTDPMVTSFNTNGMLQQRRIDGGNENTHILRVIGGITATTNTRISSESCSNGRHVITPFNPTTHTQIDFTNFLIPGQRDVIHCPFYWGKIDRYEAEALLADKPEGSFLLRDSAQDDFVFSVSFRRYSRSLHARIEEDGHRFSFDSHDPGVHASHSVRGLLEHYKDPLSCMFFEPMLLFPVIRKSCFSLQSLARASICDHTTYPGVNQLPLPKVLKQFLREYHYKHKIRTRYIDTIIQDSSR